MNFIIILFYSIRQGWGKGVIFVNGFNLGRYWSIGPTVTYYLPGPLLKKGKNEVSFGNLSIYSRSLVKRRPGPNFMELLKRQNLLKYEIS